MKESGIAIVADALKMIPKGLEKRLEELEIRYRIETVQTTALMRLAAILSPGELRRLGVAQAPIRVENSQRVK